MNENSTTAVAVAAVIKRAQDRRLLKVIFMCEKKKNFF